MNDLVFTLWDVGHGLSIWISMPNGQHHWIDLGRTPDFSPSEHVASQYGAKRIDYLIVSHPDEDHIADLPSFLQRFGPPRVLLRNRELRLEPNPVTICRRDFRDLHTGLTGPVAWQESPSNPNVNGGVSYESEYLPPGFDVRGNRIDGNDISVVVMLLYQHVLFVCPGDIEPRGWEELWRTSGDRFTRLINQSSVRFLVAPHHGRHTAYCGAMMDVVQPSMAFVSDMYGQGETHEAYRTRPTGATMRDGTTRRFCSTKMGGRIRVQVGPDGYLIDQFDP
ncbi:MAG: MBL fold metallo-hydrolase [Planctomycetota bacterium]